jgi:membrane protein insertase Oxa1/YidC/SpoIIIJ
MEGTIAIIMVFSIPIIAIITGHFQKQSKTKHKMIQDELELEKLKHQNYLIETEKMRVELELMKLDEPKDKIKLI